MLKRCFFEIWDFFKICLKVLFGIFLLLLTATVAGIVFMYCGDFLQNIGKWCGAHLCVSGFIALISLVVTIIGVFVAYKINDSVLSAECTKMYFSDEMGDAIEMLFDARDAAEEDLRRRLSDKAFDRARRRVKSYFQLAYELRCKRTVPISRNTLRRLCEVGAFPLYMDLIEKLERIKNPNYDEAPFRRLEKESKDVLDSLRGRIY